jgi:hypothetical protein
MPMKWTLFTSVNMEGLFSGGARMGARQNWRLAAENALPRTAAFAMNKPSTDNLSTDWDIQNS